MSRNLRFEIQSYVRNPRHPYPMDTQVALANETVNNLKANTPKEGLTLEDAAKYLAAIGFTPRDLEPSVDAVRRVPVHISSVDTPVFWLLVKTIAQAE